MNDLVRTCGAATNAGTPCKRSTIVGGTRCVLHGGASPEAKRKVEEALIGARLSAARVLYDIVESYERDGQRDPCPTCGFTPRGDLNPIIRAAVAVLDRTGLGAHSSVTVSHGDERLTDLTTDEMIEQTEGLLKTLYAMRDAEPRRLPEVTDVYVVPEDDEPDTVRASPQGDRTIEPAND